MMNGDLLIRQLQEEQEQELRNLLLQSPLLRLQFFRRVKPEVIPNLEPDQPIAADTLDKLDYIPITGDMVHDYVQKLNEYYAELEEADKPVQYPISLSRVIQNAKLYSLLSSVGEDDRRKVVLGTIRDKAEEIGEPLQEFGAAAACEFIEYRLTEEQAQSLYQDIYSKLGQSRDKQTKRAREAHSADNTEARPAKRRKQAYDPGLEGLIRETVYGARSDAERIAAESYERREATEPARPLEYEELKKLGGHGPFIQKGIAALRNLENLRRKELTDKKKAGEPITDEEIMSFGLAGKFCKILREKYAKGDHGLTGGQLEKRMEQALHKIKVALMNAAKKQDDDTTEYAKRRQHCLSVANEIDKELFREVYDKANPRNAEEAEGIWQDAMSVYQEVAEIEAAEERQRLEENPQERPSIWQRLFGRKPVGEAALKLQQMQEAGEKMKSSWALLKEAKLTDKSEASAALLKRWGKIGRALANYRLQAKYEADGDQELDHVILSKDFLAQFARHGQKAIEGQYIGDPDANPKRAMYIDETYVQDELLQKMEHLRREFLEVNEKCSKLLENDKPVETFGEEGIKELKKTRDTAAEKAKALDKDKWRYSSTSVITSGIEDARTLKTDLDNTFKTYQSKVKPAARPAQVQNNQGADQQQLSPQQLQQALNQLGGARRPGLGN